MRTIETNGIKIYELSKGTVIPEYLATRRQQKLKQKHKIMTSQLEVIHDLTMPDISTNISVSPDEKYLFILGAYSPRVRCYELEQLSMKFERYADELPTKIAYLDQDYSKFVILEGEKTLSFHSAGGIHKKVRMDNVVKDILYSPFKAELFIPDSKGTISLLNIETGKLSNKIFTNPTTSEPICSAAYNQLTDIFFTGTSKGLLHGFDARSAERTSTINITRAPGPEHLKPSYVPEICKLAFKDPLKLGVGTDKGMFHLYDIRNNSKPFSSRDLFYAFPVRSLVFHEDKAIAAVQSVFKIWEPMADGPGKIVANYSADSRIHDLFLFPGSGLLFAATDEPQIATYFVPRIGDAPRWCQQLSNLIVDVETESQSMYDTHTFVTREEVDDLRLSHLVGTASLRAYMHGYYVSNETFRRANEALAAEVEAAAVQRQPKVAIRGGDGGEDETEAVAMVEDDPRFAKMLTSKEMAIDPNCKAYKQVELDMRQIAKKRRKKVLLQTKAKKSRAIVNEEGSDSDAGDSD